MSAAIRSRLGERRELLAERLERVLLMEQRGEGARPDLRFALFHDEMAFLT